VSNSVRFWCLALSTIALASCLSIEGKSALTVRDYKPSGRTPEHIEIFEAASVPRRPYRSIGQLMTDCYREAFPMYREDVLDAMKKEAARIGADAVIGVALEEVPYSLVGAVYCQASGTPVVYLDR
jgi:uncharacterized protein YbjQ (UPF0145 family)